MDTFERAAHREVVEERRRGFQIHLFVYLAVNALLVVTWWLTSDGGQTIAWFAFPLIGWGIGLGAHYLAVRPGRTSRDARREPPTA